MNVRIRLARLAGAQEDILRQAPGDLAKHAAMGGVLISTALAATASAAFAMHMALGLPLLVCLVIGVAWGVVILNLDRMLVVSIGRHNGIWTNMFTAIPRLLLAMVIGAVISTPLVLRIFQPEIDSELQLMHSESLIAAQEKLAERFARIPELEKREGELQDVLAGRTASRVSEDPDVKAAQSAFEGAEKAYHAANQAAQCEFDGTCGTGVPGNGEAYRQKAAAANEAKAIRDTAKKKLDDTTASVQQRLANGAAADTEAAKSNLATVQGELARLRAEKQRAEGATAGAEENNTGLLARLEALSRLSENRPTAHLAHLSLFLLFMCIEVLPVLVKLLISFGPKTLYERLVDRRENDADKADDVWSRKQQDIAEARASVRLALEKDRATAQIKAGKLANAALVAKQTEIAQKAIDVWGKVATARSDAELARWYRQHSAAVAPAAPSLDPDATMPIALPRASASAGHPPFSNGQDTIPILLNGKQANTGQGMPNSHPNSSNPAPHGLVTGRANSHQQQGKGQQT